jgi:tetratricopeptide (TPR) repeat protein
MAYYHLKKYDAAIADYTKAIELGSGNALVNRGIVYADEGKTGLAKADFNKAINNNSHDGDAYYQLGLIAQHEQKWGEALSDVEKAVAIHPNSPVYNVLYASTLLTHDRNDEGLAAANKVLAVDENNYDGIILKASALNNLKRFDEAVTVITNGINFYPNDYIMYSTRAFIYRKMGKTTLADADEAKSKQLAAQN